MESDINERMHKIKNMIENLINENRLDEAKDAIKEYENVVDGDVEVYSMKAAIAIMEGKIDDARCILLKGLDIDNRNFDILYNLGYVYEQLGNCNEAIRYYNNSMEVCTDEEMKGNIASIIENIKLRYGDLVKESRPRITFFVKYGMDNFLEDIIEGLSAEYETRKIIVTEYTQIDEGMRWADICWFEWCDELVIYGSKSELAGRKKIVCRLHSYEAFTNYIEQVNWNNIDLLIFISEYIKKNVLGKIKIDIKTEVVPNGIDMSRLAYEEREKGFNIAYVGYINYKKGPMLLLHTFKAAFDADNRYKLYIAGKFQDERYLLYFEQMIKEMGLGNNVFYQGWQDNLDSWLEDKNCILCTSLLESQNISVMQAMSKGIKPIIHNFVGARLIYPDRYLFNTIDEAVNMIIEKDYNSQEYRKFIEDNYSLKKQINSLKYLFNNVDKKYNHEGYGDFLQEKYPVERQTKKIKHCANTLNKDKSIIKFIYNETEVKFYLPYLNDWIQKIIYENRNFYELGMLEDIKNRLGENKIVIDVGANIGNHTVFFSKICKAKNVYSFEPQKNIFMILKKNVEINEMENAVKLYNMGLGNKHCYANVNILDENNYGMSKLDKNEQGSIEINSLDNILANSLTKLDMIKIDVEGMEIEVLEGAQNIIKKFKPLVYIEAATDEEFLSVSEFFSKLGYKPVYKFNATSTYLFIYQLS